MSILDITNSIKEAAYKKSGWPENWFLDFLSRSVSAIAKSQLHYDFESGERLAAIIDGRGVALLLSKNIPWAMVRRHLEDTMEPIIKYFQVETVIFDMYEERKFTGDIKLINHLISGNIDQKIIGDINFSPADISYFCT